MDKDDLSRRAKIVADEYDGIIPHTREFYKLSLKY